MCAHFHFLCWIVENTLTYWQHFWHLTLLNKLTIGRLNSQHFTVLTLCFCYVFVHYTIWKKNNKQKPQINTSQIYLQIKYQLNLISTNCVNRNATIITNKICIPKNSPHLFTKKPYTVSLESNITHKYLKTKLKWSAFPYIYRAARRPHLRK